MFEQKLLSHIEAPLSGKLLPSQKVVYEGMPWQAGFILAVRKWETKSCMQIFITIYFTFPCMGMPTGKSNASMMYQPYIDQFQPLVYGVTVRFTIG